MGRASGWGKVYLEKGGALAVIEIKDGEREREEP